MLLTHLIFFSKLIVKKARFFLSRFQRFRQYQHFPFDIHQPLRSDAHLKMQLISTLLEIYGIKHRLTDGTVLGLYRDKQFIPHDHDIDFDILLNDNAEIGIIKKVLGRTGFSIGRIAIFESRIQQLVFYDRDATIIDLVFWRSDGDNIKNFCEKGYARVQPGKYFQNLDKVLFEGKNYFVPTPIEPWLVLRYNDWKTPKVYTDWVSDCGDIQRLND